MLGMFIKIARTFVPGKNKLMPPWQGMQYMHNMFEGVVKLEPLDNERYSDIKWTNARELLSAR
jgi:hypothetical protein